MTDKELDKLFREKFAAQDHEFRESSWDKAKVMIEKEDPAVVDELVRRKFAAQSFTFKESSWVAAKAMVDSMYRGIMLREWTTRIAMFMGVIVLTYGVDSLFSDSIANSGLESGRPALFVELDDSTEKTNTNVESAIESAELVSDDQYASTTPSGTESENKTSSTQYASASGNSGYGGESNDRPLESDENENRSIVAVADHEVESRHRADEAQNLAGIEENSVEPVVMEGEAKTGEAQEVDAASTVAQEEQELDDDAEETKERRTSPRPSAPGMFNPVRGKSSYFGLSFGGRIYQDFESTYTDEVHISPTVGLRYAYMFHPKLSLNVGTYYSSRRSTHNAHEFTGASYSFGAHKHSMTMVSSVMHQVDVPLYLRYQVARGHHVYAGAYANFTLASKNETVNSTSAPFADEVQVESAEWGHMPGLRKWGYGLVLGYDLRLNENWQIGLRGQWGLVDWSEDEVFVDSPFDRNKEIKLLLEYRLND